MKFFTFALVVVQAVLIKNAYSQCLRPALPFGCSSPVVSTVAQPSVAASLADTLSLLTVSSLLAETLPLNPNVVAVVPMSIPMTGAYAPCMSCGGCGCGGGCGYGGLGFGYNYFI